MTGRLTGLLLANVAVWAVIVTIWAVERRSGAAQVPDYSRAYRLAALLGVIEDERITRALDDK